MMKLMHASQLLNTGGERDKTAISRAFVKLIVLVCSVSEKLRLGF
jgi:hypothetical protein